VRRIRILAVLAVASALSSVSADAQSDAQTPAAVVRRGSRIRLDVGVGPRPIGTLDSVSADSISLRETWVVNQESRNTFARSEIQHAWVSHGRASRVGRGALIGTLIGGVIGVGIGSNQTSHAQFSPGPSPAVGGALGGLLGGALLGAIVGALRPGDIWVEVPVTALRPVG
jgi:hypothetical protein